MQTFLPYRSYIRCAKTLDYRRLGKQRLEARGIYSILVNKPSLNISQKEFDLIVKRYKNHPVLNLWRGYEKALLLYYNEMVKEWVYRKYKNTLPLAKVNKNKVKFPKFSKYFHYSHRSNLLRKNYQHYSKYNWWLPDNLPYIWKDRNGQYYIIKKGDKPL